MAVKTGDTVKVHYTGTLDDGTIFDSSEEREPLEFEAGEGQMIQGFDNAVIGMKVGEEKEIKLQPSEAYGDYDPSLVHEIARDRLSVEPTVGMDIVMRTPSGGQVPGKITKVSDETVTVDLNHPFAGKVLNFKIRIVDIS
ncbi:MAG: peptidylprolyl isomerase [Candidatus Aenigmarchaeota archaeon]|nr:peptidylprolyl isomerase [Candidatus Aenigmarchaeota archaeon]